MSQLTADARGRDIPRLDQARDVLGQLQQLRGAVWLEAAEQLEEWQPRIKRRSFLLSARNLAAYLALRRRDLRELQLAMMPLGLSSLGRCESRVLENLDANIALLSRAAQEGAAEAPAFPRPQTFFRGGRLLERHASEVFGPSSRQRDVRIMATLPAAAADDFELVRELVTLGMEWPGSTAPTTTPTPGGGWRRTCAAPRSRPDDCAG